MRLVSAASATFIAALFAMANPVHAANPFTAKLERERAITVPKAQCEQVEQKLGQLFYVMVSAYGSDSGDAIDPAWIRLIGELQIGGVLPHFAGFHKEKIREATKRMRAAVKEPLLIGVDYVYFPRTLSHPNLVETDRKWNELIVALGLGNGWGFIGKHGEDVPDKIPEFQECIQDLAFIEAAVHRLYGINQTLGPVIERRAKEKNSLLNDRSGKSEEAIRRIVSAYQSLGLAVTMKHYPFEPKTFNLHKQNRDEPVSLQESQDRIEVFRRARSQFPFAMTTHLWNSRVDPKHMATFSKIWIDLLRKDLGYDGLLMTDGLFMISSYGNNADAAVKEMIEDWQQDTPKKITKRESLFAIRALLAGHDIVLTEGDSKDTRDIFRDLHYLACQNTANGNALRAQILTASARIARYKMEVRTELTQFPDFPNELYRELVEFVGANSSPGHIVFQSFCKNREPRKKLVEKLQRYFRLTLNSSVGLDTNGSGRQVAPAK